MKKGLLACAVLLTLAVLMCGASLFVSADTPTGGICGTGVTWEFEEDSSILSIKGNGAMSNYSSAAEVPWNRYASQIITILIYEDVTHVGDYAFANCTSLVTVGYNGTSALEIGAYAFAGCESLVNVPVAIKSIDKYAFEGCASFEMFVIPGGVETLNEGTFKDCTSLTKVVVPATVTEIQTDVLNGCESLARFVYCGTEDQWNSVVKADGWNANAGDFEMRFHDFCAYEGTCICGVSAGDGNYHHYDPEDEGEVQLEPTHTSIGVRIYKCVDCGTQRSEIIPEKADDHTWGGEWVEKNDYEHEKTCECEATLTEPHGGEWEKVDDTNHKKVCKCGYVETAPHEFDNGVITTPATHTQEGVITETCGDCKATRTKKIAKLPDHTYGAWTDYNESWHKQECECGDEQFGEHAWDNEVVTKQPTHTEEGVKTYTCHCGAIKNETVEKLSEHTYGDNWVKHDDEKHKKLCDCGDVIYADHTWNEGEMTVEPTHLEFGVWTFVCSDCGATKTEDVPKLTEHTYGDWEKHNQSQHKKSCACGDVQYLDHNWDAGVTVKEPTHTEEGATKHICADCGETKNVPIAKLTAHTHGAWNKHDEEHHKRVCACGDTRYASHRWNDGEVKKAATHMAEGSILYTCADCGQTLTETLPKIETHSFGKWKQGEDGHEKTCNCGAVMHEDHRFGKWTLVTPATAEEAGVRERACDVCGFMQSEEIPMQEKSAAVLGTGGVIGITVSFAVLLGVGGFWFVSPELIGDSTFVSKKKRKAKERESVGEEPSDDID